jgi:hypothetical protein
MLLRSVSRGALPVDGASARWAVLRVDEGRHHELSPATRAGDGFRAVDRWLGAGATLPAARRRSVAPLLDGGRPSGIAGFVAAVVIDPVERHAAGPFAQVGEEVPKAFRPQPPRIDMDAAPAVARKVSAPRLEASSLHGSPRLVGGRLGLILAIPRVPMSTTGQSEPPCGLAPLGGGHRSPPLLLVPVHGRITRPAGRGVTRAEIAGNAESSRLVFQPWMASSHASGSAQSVVPPAANHSSIVRS